MKTLKEKAPALYGFFFKSKSDILIDIERPIGCSRCPFAEEYKQWGERPNPADPDEGYYSCRLLQEEKLWGESPRCSPEDWRNKAVSEIESIAEHSIQQEIIEEKADALIGEFAAALQDESNGDLTLNQVKEKLLAKIEPRVLAAFNAKLRPYKG